MEQQLCNTKLLRMRGNSNYVICNFCACVGTAVKTVQWHYGRVSSTYYMLCSVAFRPWVLLTVMFRDMSAASFTYCYVQGHFGREFYLHVMLSGISSVISTYMLCSVACRAVSSTYMLCLGACRPWVLLTCYVQGHVGCEFYLHVMFRGMLAASSTYCYVQRHFVCYFCLHVMFSNISSVIFAYMLCSVAFRLLFLLNCYVQWHVGC